MGNLARSIKRRIERRKKQGDRKRRLLATRRSRSQYEAEALEVTRVPFEDPDKYWEKKGAKGES